MCGGCAEEGQRAGEIEFADPQAARATVTKLLELLGENPAREGLRDTPARVIRSWERLFGGYRQNPGDVLKTAFCETCDEMVVLRDIEFYSTCEHHMLPFFGRAAVGYIPNGKVVGISKLARLVECFSRRLQIQERLTRQIAEAIEEHLKPLGVAVVLRAQHLCMVARGVEKQNSVMVTSSMLGKFRDDQSNARREFLALAGG